MDKFISAALIPASHLNLIVPEPKDRRGAIFKGVVACLYQMQRVNGEAKLQFIDAAGHKTLLFERNYHSYKGEMAALHYRSIGGSTSSA